jgi:hypothetical protein
MTWQVMLALVIVIPVILIPVFFVWYLNLGGIYAAIKERQSAHKQSKKGTVEAGQHVPVMAQEQPLEK